MSNEMTGKLAKYMKEDGFYDTVAIRRDEGMDDMLAVALQMLGGDYLPAETKSELLTAAEAHNEAKMNAEAEVELDRNTAEAVYSAMMVDDYSRLAEQETVRRANQMRDGERRKLVTHLLERIETINSELDANVTTHSYERNRALYVIEQMRFGRGFGDVADQSGGVDIAAAYNYVSGDDANTDTFIVTSDLIGTSEPATVRQLAEVVAGWEQYDGWTLTVREFGDEVRVYADADSDESERPSSFSGWRQVTPDQYYHVLAERA